MHRQIAMSSFINQDSALQNVNWGSSVLLHNNGSDTRLLQLWHQPFCKHVLVSLFNLAFSKTPCELLNFLCLFNLSCIWNICVCSNSVCCICVCSNSICCICVCSNSVSCTSGFPTKVNQNVHFNGIGNSICIQERNIILSRNFYVQQKRVEENMSKNS